MTSLLSSGKTMPVAAAAASGIGEDEEIDVWGRHRKMVEALLLRLAKEAAEASSCSSSSSSSEPQTAIGRSFSHSRRHRRVHYYYYYYDDDDHHHR